MSQRPVVAVVVVLVVFGASVGSVGFVDRAAAQDSVLVEADITSDTTWAADTGPYRVVKSIAVAKDATLTIEPGVTVEVAEGVSITVEGNLQAVGSAENPIEFTSSKESPTPGSWDTLRLAGSFGSLTRVHHARITYAQDGISLADSQRVSLEQVEIAHAARAGINGTGSDGYSPKGEITIRDSSLHHNQFGIRGYDERYRIVDSEIRNNSRSGVKLTNTLNIVGLSVRGSTVADNDIGINLESDVDQHNRGGDVTELVVADSTIASNSGVGLRVFGDRLIGLAVRGTTISGNGGNGVHLQDIGRAGGSRPTTNLTVRDSTIEENGNIGLKIDAAYSDLSGVIVADTTVASNGASGAVVEADREASSIEFSGSVARLNGGHGVAINGTASNGLQVRNVRTFANGANGISIDGGALSDVQVTDAQSAQNGQAGIAVNGTSDGAGTTIVGSILAGNDVGITVSNHPASIRGVLVEYNNRTGIAFVGAGSRGNTIEASDIYGNGQGMHVPETAGALVANVTNNYWGAASGPYHASINPEGDGNSLNGGLETVAFLPYAESPFVGVNERPTASLEVSATNATVGTPVEFSAAASTDDGSVAWYRFAFNNSTNTGWVGESTITRSFEHPGTYVVNVSVADDHGASSAANATATIHVRPPANETTTTSGGGSSNGGSNSGGSDGSGTAGDGDDFEVKLPGFGFGISILALLAALLALSRRAEKTKSE